MHKDIPKSNGWKNIMIIEEDNGWKTWYILGEKRKIILENKTWQIESQAEKGEKLVLKYPKGLKIPWKLIENIPDIEIHEITNPFDLEGKTITKMEETEDEIILEINNVQIIMDDDGYVLIARGQGWLIARRNT